MLVLTRRKYESVRMTVPPSSAPTEIMLTVVRVDAGNVRLGFDAPLEVTIVRTDIPLEKKGGSDPASTTF